MVSQSNWHPYVAGSLTGLLISGSLWITGQLFGASSSFVRTAGFIGQQVNPEYVEQSCYFNEVKPKIDWQWMFVLGITLGSFISAITSGSFKLQSVPDMWAKRFGNNPIKRWVVAFIGGILALFGVRLANGCPSGQMGGIIQLSMGSFVAMVSFFLGGIFTSRLLYGGGEE